MATLSLAMAADVVVAGVANGLLFHKLPVVNAQQLVQMQNPGAGLAFSYPNYRDLRDRSTDTFSSVAIAQLTRTAMTIDGAAQPVWVFGVSGNYFPMLRVQPQRDRLLLPSEDLTRNGSGTIVLSNRLWRTRFDADPQVIGQRILVGDNPLTMVGVVPRDFHGTKQLSIQRHGSRSTMDGSLMEMTTSSTGAVRMRGFSRGCARMLLAQADTLFVELLHDLGEIGQ